MGIVCYIKKNFLNIIIYLDEWLEDLKFNCISFNGSVLGIDCIFNLGFCFVMIIIYKNWKVVKCEIF